MQQYTNAIDRLIKEKAALQTQNASLHHQNHVEHVKVTEATKALNMVSSKVQHLQKENAFMKKFIAEYGKSGPMKMEKRSDELEKLVPKLRYRIQKLREEKDLIEKQYGECKKELMSAKRQAESSKRSLQDVTTNPEAPAVQDTIGIKDWSNVESESLSLEALKKYLMEAFGKHQKKSSVMPPKQIAKVEDQKPLELEFPTMQTVVDSEWFHTRPKVIQDAIIKLPPTRYYSLNGRQCFIIAYSEPESRKKEVTVRVQKTGVGGPMAEMGLGSLDQNQVFGIKLSDLSIWRDTPPSKEVPDFFTDSWN